MISDVVITSGSLGEELGVAQVEGLTDAGEEFVDAYIESEIVVVDAGRIVVRLADVSAIVAKCERLGLSVEAS